MGYLLNIFKQPADNLTAISRQGTTLRYIITKNCIEHKHSDELSLSRVSSNCPLNIEFEAIEDPSSDDQLKYGVRVADDNVFVHLTRSASCALSLKK